MNIELGHWEYTFLTDDETAKKRKTFITEQFTELPYGFIYQITNKVNNKKYIGKKQCVTVKKLPPLKGMTNKRHKTVETDWKSYTSSSRELNEDIVKHGKDNFTFEILLWCNSKWELSYYEGKLQFELGVLLKDEYYNGIISLRIGKKPINSII
jgi:hypothetical protein